ncbi:hypothetical protein A2738_00585 [Candidatus Nomurabacteria bacterium RIFCSPHIGHO2_01_FULL_42_15]|uniref:Glycosyl transferase family 1 domain-containing protein n=1 Tax=Candidatus Nomurabacteria bacterium RIFCSPHIGHO2_01_FULL_42_15 TaxID=1801742 RepID=A0A1F6VFG8_9BACT|nr:MAG: hypothetical protein A2738_00585 [Candidatus Nomurabacteria bacterium RIFCSPHIGHO2_01_FULL_42_15]OGI93206.1 MAG: hypothetical protein A3A99_01585 [Candidatus Nomurabacteria bacterium RIFCSPLOWO2_01_FULL_41_18]
MTTLTKEKDIGCVVYVTTYPPRECGIANFSADLISYSDELFLEKVESKVVAMDVGPVTAPLYSPKVIFQIEENNKVDYISVADKLNAMPEVKMVSIQHEFGIFGENYGNNIALFLEKLEKPSAVTFHTVLPRPESGMKSVMEKIIRHSDLQIVMTELSKKLLIEIYGAKAEKIKVTPHGIHPQQYVDTLPAQKELKLENKTILATFGLLSSGKGIEYAIAALPGILEKYPNTIYLVLGQTHPVVLRREGEIYRNKLIAQAKNLGVEKNVVFVNKYLSRNDLLLYLQATDIYLALSQNPDQAVSGTLTYALGAGRAVISTAFMQAKEIVTKEVGRLVPFSDSKSIELEVLKLLENKKILENMGKSAYLYTRNMTWPNVALSYMNIFSPFLSRATEKNKFMLPVNIAHIKKMTDNFGIFQFALLSNPDPKWGYTLDDNARALVALSWYNDLYPSEEAESLINIFLKFIERSSIDTGGFVNYFNTDRNPHNELNQNENLEDSNARALWALSVASTNTKIGSVKKHASTLFQKQFKLHKKVISPRAAAFYIKAFVENLSHHENTDEARKHIEFYADFLVDMFEETSDDKWKWFEKILAYSNGILPDALLAAYSVSGNPKYFKVAKASLDFLIEQSFEGDICVPVGQGGWFKKDGKKERYDQQPEEVSALILALHKMILVEDDPIYRQKMMLAFDWFFGNNLSKQMVYTHSTGGTYDGVQEEGVNLNQGAESTIAYLLARLIMEINQE